LLAFGGGSELIRWRLDGCAKKRANQRRGRAAAWQRSWIRNLLFIWAACLATPKQASRRPSSFFRCARVWVCGVSSRGCFEISPRASC